MKEWMQAAVVTAPGRVELREVPRPAPGPFDALTRTLAASFCRGTDRHLIAGTLPFGPPPPFILGHEGVGEVVAVGEGCRRFQVGDRVLRAGAAYPPGAPNAPRVGWGGFAEYGIVTDVQALHEAQPNARPTAVSPAMQQRVPPEMPPAHATVLITLKETLSALRRANLRPGQSLLVHGTGPVALAFAHCARALAAVPILAVGGHLGRLDRMLAFGAHQFIHHRGGPFAPAVKAATGGRGVDLVIDAVGDRTRLGELLACLAPGGAVGLYGVPEGSLDEYRRFSFDTSGAPNWWSLTMLNPDEPSAHEEVCALAAQGKLLPDRFVTHTFPFARFSDALEALEEPFAAKVVVTF